MYYEPRKVVLLTVDGQFAFLSDGAGLDEMTALHEQADAAGVVLAQCGMRWDGHGFGDTICYETRNSSEQAWRPRIPLRPGEFWSGKFESDGTSNPALMDFIASVSPAVVIVQGRAINDCAANTGCSIKRDLRKLGLAADVVLALDSGCARANFEHLYKSRPYADIPRRVAMQDITIDARGVYVPPVVPRMRRAFNADMPVAD